MSTHEATPLDPDEIRRNYLPDMLEARGRGRNWCECQKGGVDAVSIDGDWLHVAGERFAQAVVRSNGYGPACVSPLMLLARLGSAFLATTPARPHKLTPTRPPSR